VHNQRSSRADSHQKEGISLFFLAQITVAAGRGKDRDKK
jgi:hypothetical protein